MTSSRYGRDVEEVLNSANALDSFKEWIRIDPNRSEEVPDLYFALKGFKNYLRSHDAPIRAQMIHRKYISLKTGTCQFLPNEVRQEMSNRIHNLKSNAPVSATLFDPVWNPLLTLLRSWHTHFICSEPYNLLLANEMDDMNEGYTEVLSTQEFARKHRKPRYSCDASTSKALVDVERTLDGYSDKVPNSSYRHEKEEERERFVRDISEKLQKIADEIERIGGGVYARDLPKASQESFSVIKEKVVEETASDEELSKYADKIGRRRSTSESPPMLNNTAFTPLQSSFVPTVPGYNFNVTIPERYTLQRKARTPGFYDTSGFCSSESAYFSSERSYGQRSSGFNEGSSFHRASPFQSHTLQRRAPAAHLPAQNVFATLPRKMSQPKVECRLWRDGEVAPYSAKLPGPVITFHQFRRTFGIRRNENTRLLFKSPCEDDSAPFQWSLISDDDQTLPVFEGKITAEARVYVDSD